MPKHRLRDLGVRLSAPARVGGPRPVEPVPPPSGSTCVCIIEERDRAAGTARRSATIQSISLPCAPAGSPPLSPAVPAGTSCNTPRPVLGHRLEQRRRARPRRRRCPARVRRGCRGDQRCGRWRSRARRHASAWRTIAAIASMSSAVASVVRAALPHHVGAHRGVGHVGADVEGARHPLERVEVLGERLPVQRHALRQRAAGDVLDPLHQLDEPLLAARVARARSRRRSCRARRS